MDTIISGDNSTTTNDIRNQLSELDGESYYQNWLELLSSQVAGSFAALLALKSKERNLYQPVAVWPAALPDAELFSDLVERVIEEGSGLVLALEGTDGSATQNYALAYPVHVDQQLTGVVVLALSVVDESQLKPVMQQLQWGGSWLELPELRGQLKQEQNLNRNLKGAVDLLSRVLPEPDFDTASMRLISELADLLNCNLVSIGLVRKKSVQLCHLSFSADFSKKMNLVRAIEAAMDESVDQRSLVQFPGPDNSSLVSLAHRALSEQQGDEAVLSVPLFLGDHCFGAVMLQRDGERSFTKTDTDYCESILALSASVLEEKRLNSRPLWKKATASAGTQLKRLFGRRYPGRKLFAVIAIGIIAALTNVTGDYRLSSNALLETAQKRVVVAPYDGYIREAPLRAGDEVAEGQLLVRFDDRDLKLEQLRWQSQKTQLQRQYQDAIAKHDRSGINIIAARIAQAEAQLQLVEVQLERSQQASAVDGRVIAGDLSQRLGGAVTKGEALFEVAPRDAYRVSLNVQENRISDVQLGQAGTLHLSALPEQVFPFVVSRITPVTVSEDGASYFVVEAELEQADRALLQPGMEGVGKVAVDQRLLISIWTREMLEWLRLKRWMWLG